MSKYDKSLEYISNTQTLVGQKKKELIDVETGDYNEFKMNVDASINHYQDYTVWQRKGIDDYFYSLVRLKNKQQRKN